MTTALVLIVFVALVSGVAARLNELFYLSIRDGQLLVVRGRVPLALLDAFAEIVREARIRRGGVRAIPDDDRTNLIMRGIPEDAQQQLRNVFGIHHLSLYRSPVQRGRNLGQVLGITWLAWRFFRRGSGTSVRVSLAVLVPFLGLPSAAIAQKVVLQEVMPEFRNDASLQFLELRFVYGGLVDLGDVTIQVHESGSSSVSGHALDGTWYVRDGARLLIGSPGIAARLGETFPDAVFRPPFRLPVHAGTVCLQEGSVLQQCLTYGPTTTTIRTSSTTIIATTTTTSTTLTPFHTFSGWQSGSADSLDWSTPAGAFVHAAPSPRNSRDERGSLGQRCGNEVLEGGELCERNSPIGFACTDLFANPPFTGGEPTCNLTTCQPEASSCHRCGDGQRNEDGAGVLEECDDQDVGDETCDSNGYRGGTLGCRSTCAIDTTACNRLLYVRGGPRNEHPLRRARTDCFAEFIVEHHDLDPEDRKTRQRLRSGRIECTQGDPACDFDEMRRTCEFHVGVCFGARRTKRCVPRDVESWKVKYPKDEREVSDLFEAVSEMTNAAPVGRSITFAPILEADRCTRQARLSVTVGEKVRLKTRARPEGGGTDVDALQLECLP